MDRERWQRIKELFARATELPVSARMTFLRAETESDSSLLDEVLELLSADGQASSFLDGGPVETAVPNQGSAGAWVGRHFGPYRATQELGRGGMGVVVLAERDDGRFKGEVAIKVVQTALLRNELVVRFHTEGQILAALDHPNIARLHDAGETEDGLSYLIMEYVNGPRIDVFADEQLLGVPERLGLFRSVLEGVDYAHTQGVIHRDLKPSNILVTRDGHPKLVDFGIAKLLAPTEGQDPTVAMTRTHARMMTPEYASPEQVRGLSVSTTSDVYSLGVVLYRLLTGRPPYALPTTQPRAAERIICEETPRRPSSAVTQTVPPAQESSTVPAPDPSLLARRRASTLERLQRALRGDLDTIILKALSKEPEGRYETAGAFSADIGRHLDGRAILAHRPSFAYRTRKYAWRRRVPIAVTALVLAGLGAAGWQASVAAGQREQAQANSEEITRLATSVMGTLSGLQRDQRGPTAAREDLVTAAIESLSQLMARVDGTPSPAALMTLASAYTAAGDVQGSLFGANLGKPEEAERSYGAALELLEQVVAVSPETEGAIPELAWVRVRLADVYRALGEHSRITPLLALAQPVLDSLARENPLNPTTISRQATAYERLGMSHDDRGDLESAIEAFQTALALREEIAYDEMEEADAREALSLLAVTRTQAGWVLSRAGREEEAILISREAAKLADSVAAFPETSPATIRLSAVAHQQLAWRLAESDSLEEAEIHFTEALSILRPLWRVDARNVLYVGDVGAAHEGRGNVRVRAEDWEGALEDQRAAIAILEPRLADIPTAAFQVAQAFRQAGESLTALSRLDEAEAEFVRSLEVVGGVLARDSTYTPGKLILSLTLSSFETLYLVRASREEDARSCTEAIALGDSVRGLWTKLTEAGQVAPGVQSIWEEFEARKPVGVC